jgi:hypothetical protein
MSDHVTLLQLLYDITSEWPETLNICMVRTTLASSRTCLVRLCRSRDTVRNRVLIGPVTGLTHRSLAGKVHLVILVQPGWRDKLPIERDPVISKVVKQLTRYAFLTCMQIDSFATLHHTMHTIDAA